MKNMFVLLAMTASGLLYAQSGFADCGSDVYGRPIGAVTPSETIYGLSIQDAATHQQVQAGRLTLARDEQCNKSFVLELNGQPQITFSNVTETSRKYTGSDSARCRHSIAGCQNSVIFSRTYAADSAQLQEYSFDNGSVATFRFGEQQFAATRQW